MTAPTRIAAAALLCLAAATLSSPRAQGAEELVADLTSHHIDVRFDFAGATVTLFGTVVGRPIDGSDESPDLVIAVRGPAKPVRVHRKARFAGVWVNRESVAFKNVPGYYALVSSRPLSRIASAQILRKLGLGFDSVSTQLGVSPEGRRDPAAGDFAEATVRLLRRKGLYRRHPTGIKFIGNHLFRAEFSLPANVPVGSYDADIFLFRKGNLLGEYTTAFDISKSGMERTIYSMAIDQPLLYGILSVLLAIAAGLGASFVFRKS